MNTGTGETALTGGGIHTYSYEINAASEINDDVYEGVLSGVAWIYRGRPVGAADVNASAFCVGSGFARIHGGGGGHGATGAAREAVARNSAEDGDRRRWSATLDKQDVRRERVRVTSGRCRAMYAAGTQGRPVAGLPRSLR